MSAIVVLLVEGSRAERQQVVRHLLQEGLGQRRPLVGDVAFGGDEGERPVIALGAQARGDLRAAMPAADDDDSASVHPSALSLL